MKELQWLIPMVWPPERATTSVASNFFCSQRGEKGTSVACWRRKIGQCYCNTRFPKKKMEFIFRVNLVILTVGISNVYTLD